MLFSDRLRAERVTRLTGAPSFFNAILGPSVDTAPRLPCLKMVFCSGETLSLSTMKRLRYAFPTCSLFNLYGATETSGDCASYMFSEDSKSSIQNESVPIGTALVGTRTVMHVVDRETLRLRLGIAVTISSY